MQIIRIFSVRRLPPKREKNRATTGRTSILACSILGGCPLGEASLLVQAAQVEQAINLNYRCPPEQAGMRVLPRMEEILRCSQEARRKFYLRTEQAADALVLPRIEQAADA
ncbi:MAG: hypothetical protein ACPGWR_03460 [Ardenticatenaceae bacterium]